MLFNFSNIKIKQPEITNNDVTVEWINTCKLLRGVENIVLPVDYLIFIKQFGEGAIGDHIYIFPIEKLFDRTKFWREDNPTKAEAIFFKKNNRNDCTVIGETSDGDIIMYLKHDYYLSTRQYEERIYKLGSTLNDIFDFHINHKKYGGRCDVNTFNTINS